MNNTQKYLGIPISGDLGVAITCESSDCAIVLANITWFLRYNRRNPEAIREGKVWSYRSYRHIAESLGYLTERQVKHCVKILVEKGYLEVGNYNTDPFKKTNWYTLTNQEIITQINSKMSFDGTILSDDKTKLSDDGTILSDLNKERNIEQRTNIATEKEKEATSVASCPKRSSQAKSQRTVASPIALSQEFTFNGINEEDKASWKVLYPSVEIEREILAMQEWCKSNPAKANSKRQWRKFITGWLSRQNEKLINSEARKQATNAPQIPRYPPKKEDWPKINKKKVEEWIKKNPQKLKHLQLSYYYVENPRTRAEVDFRLIDPDDLLSQVRRVSECYDFLE